MSCSGKSGLVSFFQHPANPPAKGSGRNGKALGTLISNTDSGGNHWTDINKSETLMGKLQLRHDGHG